MFTYCLQNRVFRGESPGIKLDDQGSLHALIHYTPKHAFLEEIQFGRTIISGHNAETRFDANSGKSVVRPKAKGMIIEAILETDSQKFTQIGSVMSIECSYSSLDEVENLLFYFAFVYPAFLNVRFGDPVRVERVEGTINGTHVRWEHSDIAFAFKTTSKTELEESCIEAIQKMGRLNEDGLAAINYLNKASRFAATCEVPGEVYGEVVLNLVRTLQAMFGNDRNHIRSGLDSLGFTKEEIENDFIPLLLIRNELDVGHIRKRIPRHEEMDLLFKYILLSELSVKDAVSRWLLTDNCYVAAGVRSTEHHFDAKDQANFDKIIDSIKRSSKLQ